MKIIRINGCGDCPYWQCGWVEEPDEEGGDPIFHDGVCIRLRRNVSNINKILEKCPLEDEA